MIRKPGSLVVYKDTEGTLKLTMDDKGEVTGFTGSGGATWVFASGDAAPPEGQEAALDRQGDGDRAPSPSTRKTD